MNASILDNCADSKNQFASYILVSTGAFCTIEKRVSGKIVGQFRKPMRKQEALRIWEALVRDQYFRATQNWHDAEALASRRVSAIRTLH